MGSTCCWLDPGRECRVGPGNFTPSLSQKSRLADNHHKLPIALPRPIPAPHQHGDLLVAPNERRELALAGAASAAARADDPEQRYWLRHALEFMAAALLGHE
jgi:hypothetical protein